MTPLVLSRAVWRWVIGDLAVCAISSAVLIFVGEPAKVVVGVLLVLFGFICFTLGIYFAGRHGRRIEIKK